VKAHKILSFCLDPLGKVESDVGIASGRHPRDVGSLSLFPCDEEVIAFSLAVGSIAYAHHVLAVFEALVAGQKVGAFSSQCCYDGHCQCVVDGGAAQSVDEIVLKKVSKDGVVEKRLLSGHD